jgi:hypothetical protein
MMNMAENNGGDLERRVSVLEQARKEMEDTMLVMAHLEAAAGRRVKEHAQFIADHEEWMHHFQAKLDGLTDILMRREGGPEAGD